MLISVGNFWLIFLIFLLTGIFCGLRYIYVNIARCMKRIEATGNLIIFARLFGRRKTFDIVFNLNF